MTPLSPESSNQFSPFPGRSRVPVAVLGATGTVGTRLLERLQDHPWFRVAEVAASERSEGRILGEHALRPPSGPFHSHLVLSALPANVAREVEPLLAGRGHLVVSNASAFRDDPGVPLIVPEVNPDHLRLLDDSSGGGIVTNPNCAVAGLMPALAPLHSAFGVTRVLVTTFQAISGAGRPGPAAASLIDNVIPWIGGEEEKIAREPGKILGTIEGGVAIPADITVSATATRVPVLHGHLESVSVELAQPVSVDQAIETWRAFRAPDIAARLPTSPLQPVVILTDDDRPQPRLDRDTYGGMAVSVGRIRLCEILTLKFIVLSHNLERGAAGAALLNAELAAAEGRVRDSV